MLKFNVSGEVYLRLTRDNKLLKEFYKRNLFLLQGRQHALYGLGNGINTYIILSSSVVAPTLNDVSIPSVYSGTGAVAKPSYISSTLLYSTTKRVHDQFSAPVAPRTINTIGLAHASDGSSAICFTNLLATVNQGITDTLDVYYSLTFSPYT